jgi:serine/threonine kinase PknH
VEEPTASNTTPGSRAGSRFGHYRLIRLLGWGGFGEVYEAEDTVMDRAVALKLLAAPYSQNEVFRERLYREARNAGKLHEPHVVPIHHCGEIDGQLYIDMRLIEGTDLQKVLVREGPLSPARAVAIVRQIASALDAAHSVQMVHRDIKPANILLADDFACLVDFGLANAATDANLTSTGMTMGTFAYMAPERFSNTDVSHRADIYALACVLYECLTGEPPYPTGDLPALINAHLTAPIPRPSRRLPQIPAGFDDVIAVGLAKGPNNRFDSAGDLAVVARHALRPASQREADAIVATTQAARQRTHPHAGAAVKPSADSPAKNPRLSANPVISSTDAKSSNLRTIATIAATLVVLVIVATTIWVIGHRHDDSSQATTTTASPPSQSATPPPTPAPTSSSVTAEPPTGVSPTSSSVTAEPPTAVSPTATPPIESESLDARFTITIEQRGITMQSAPGAIKAAHAVCKMVSQGDSLESIAAQVVRQNPGLTPQLATVFVDTALSVYCPQGDY